SERATDEIALCDGNWVLYRPDAYGKIGGVEFEIAVGIDDKPSARRRTTVGRGDPPHLVELVTDVAAGQRHSRLRSPCRQVNCGEAAAECQRQAAEGAKCAQ